MNYIDELADEIHAISNPREILSLGDPYRPLFRIYAVLALVKGEATTTRDVHDAWSAWCAKANLQHPSLVPFEELNEVVQLLDVPYVEAIHKVAASRE